MSSYQLRNSHYIDRTIAPENPYTLANSISKVRIVFRWPTFESLRKQSVILAHIYSDFNFRRQDVGVYLRITHKHSGIDKKAAIWFFQTILMNTRLALYGFVTWYRARDSANAGGREDGSCTEVDDLRLIVFAAYYVGLDFMDVQLYVSRNYDFKAHTLNVNTGIGDFHNRIAFRTKSRFLRQETNIYNIAVTKSLTKHCLNTISQTCRITFETFSMTLTTSIGITTC